MIADDISLSWVLASSSPQRLARFYADLLGTSPRAGAADHHWIVPLPERGILQIYTPSRSRPWPITGSALAPCLQRKVGTDPLRVLQTWQRQVVALGGRSTEEPRLESFGAECWLEDPEGQRFLLLVLQSGTDRTARDEQTENP